MSWSIGVGLHLPVFWTCPWNKSNKQLVKSFLHSCTWDSSRHEPNQEVPCIAQHISSTCQIPTYVILIISTLAAKYYLLHHNYVHVHCHVLHSLQQHKETKEDALRTDYSIGNLTAWACSLCLTTSASLCSDVSTYPESPMEQKVV